MPIALCGVCVMHACCPPVSQQHPAHGTVSLFSVTVRRFVLGKDYDPDRERAEQRRLQRQLKKESRGAARELRKDNHFLALEKAKEKAAALEERREKNRKGLAFLEQQEHAYKSGQLGGRKKRRGKR